MCDGLASQLKARNYEEAIDLYDKLDSVLFRFYGSMLHLRVHIKQIIYTQTTPLPYPRVTPRALPFLPSLAAGRKPFSRASMASYCTAGVPSIQLFTLRSPLPCPRAAPPLPSSPPLSPLPVLLTVQLDAVLSRLYGSMLHGRGVARSMLKQHQQAALDLKQASGVGLWRALEEVAH
ncbi:unnamed protein product [Closterium sp. NIES-53]